MLRRLGLAILTALALMACAAVVRAQVTETSVTLQWTAPGDDSTAGTATRYDVRWSTAPIDDANFASANAVTGVPAPQVAGSTETFTVTGLVPSTAYWFAIKTVDDRGNWSGISNLATATTAVSSDSLRPAALTIAMTAVTDNSVTLGWTAVGDDSLTGTATQYDVRWSTTPITVANWANATKALGAPAPSAPGSAESMIVTPLDRTVDLYFAAQVKDDVNHVSALSNVLLVPHLLDTAPPASPSGVAANAPAPGSVHVHWTANSEPDLEGYFVYRANSSSGPWSKLNSSIDATLAYDDAAAPDTGSVWYTVSAVDVTGNESARSASVKVSMAGAGIVAWDALPAYPNPSPISSPVTIPVQVPATGPFDGRIDVQNSAGEHVRTIELRNLSPGPLSVVWDGRNDAGRTCAPGVYRAWLLVGGKHAPVKLVRTP